MKTPIKHLVTERPDEATPSRHKLATQENRAVEGQDCGLWQLIYFDAETKGQVSG